VCGNDGEDGGRWVGVYGEDTQHNNKFSNKLIKTNALYGGGLGNVHYLHRTLFTHAILWNNLHRTYALLYPHHRITYLMPYHARRIIHIIPR